VSGPQHQPERQRTLALAIGAIGVVYGDIGTSPLYTLKECLGGAASVGVTDDNVLGILSLIFWALILAVTLKYVVVVLRADNQGEGGVLALMALAQRSMTTRRGRYIVSSLGITGAALFYGDGMITPAISVLSAVEGIEVIAPALEPVVLPIALAIVIGLFLVQDYGTERIGKYFGPILCVWFTTLAVLGLSGIWRAPQVLQAIDPRHAAGFLAHHGWLGFVALGAVVLAVTGAEALYADMGHFGRRPIRLAWSSFVLPALVLNYFGQGALLLADPAAIRNPFYLLAPSWALWPMVILAAMATVVASQAVISGAFSVTRQAIQLGFAPRMEVRHTSAAEIGQIYLPPVNWFLFICVVGLILGFRSSSALAGAYGIAVTGTMAVTTLLLFLVMRKLWGWPAVLAGLAAAGFLVIDAGFLLSTLLKIFEGGWFPLLMGGALALLLSTWTRGRRIVLTRMREGAIPLDQFIGRVREGHPLRVPGVAVFMTSERDNTPHALLHNLKHNKVLHEQVVLLSVVTPDRPRVPESERTTYRALGKGFHRLTMQYGFTETPDVPKAMAAADCGGLRFDPMQTSFFLGRERLIATHSGMPIWQDILYIWMQRNALGATEFFQIPSNRVVELGAEVEL
jgi:KUP system potassium uptake protein